MGNQVTFSSQMRLRVCSHEKGIWSEGFRPDCPWNPCRTTVAISMGLIRTVGVLSIFDVESISKFYTNIYSILHREFEIWWKWMDVKFKQLGWVHKSGHRKKSLQAVPWRIPWSLLCFCNTHAFCAGQKSLVYHAVLYGTESMCATETEQT